MRLKWIAPLAALTLVLAACGDDDGGALGGPATSTAPTPTTQAPAGNGNDLLTGELGEAMMADAVQGMIAAGFDPVQAECVVGAMMAEFGADELIALSGDSEPSPEVGFRMIGIFDECGIDMEDLTGVAPGETPTDFRELAQPRSDVPGPYTYGDDATLDALWDACEAGSGSACDDLYFDSMFGSEYEAFGFTCGNRMELNFDCTSLGG